MTDRRWKLAGAGLACVPALVLLGAVAPVRALANTAVPCNSAALVSAINGAAFGDTLDLASGCTYSYATADNATDAPGNALPVINSTLTINGQGATITRAAAAPSFRLLDIGATGIVTLLNTTVSNGGSDGILDHGSLTLTGDTITGNTGSGVDEATGAQALTATSTGFSNNTQNGLSNHSTALVTLVSVNATNNANAGVISDGPISASGVSMTGNTYGLMTYNPSANNAITVTDSALSNNSSIDIDSSGSAMVTRTSLGAATVAVVTQLSLTLDTVSISGTTSDGVVSAQASGSTSVTKLTETTAGGNGVIASTGATTITGSTITQGGAEAGVGILTSSTTALAHITGTTVSGFSDAVITAGPGLVESSTLHTGANGLIVEGATTLTDSTVSGFSNGVIVGAGASTITGSTVSNNSNVGIVGHGSGSTLAITRSTVTNSNVGISGADSLTGSTIAGNATVGVAGVTTVTDSILSTNGGANCNGTTTDGGNNVTFPASDISCPTTFTRGDPKLDTLRDNGGPTPTMALLDGSVAAGLTPVGATGCTAADTDQRGVPRLQNGQACDAGAFELDSTSTSVAPSATSLTAGQTLTLAGIVTPFSAIPGAPSGTLSFFNGGTLFATVTLTNGHAADGPLTLPVGTYTVVATFPGARGFLASTSAPVTVTISPPVPSVGAARELPSPVAPALLVFGGLGLLGAARRRR